MSKPIPSMCPRCRGYLRPAGAYHAEAVVCRSPECGWSSAAAPSAPGATPKPKQKRRHPEADLEASIQQALELAGYHVMHTSERRAAALCPKPGCGTWFYPTQGRGCDKGVPDLLVRHPTWPVAMHIGLEVKLPGYAKSAVSPEQKIAAELHATIIVTSIEEALLVARAAT